MGPSPGRSEAFPKPHQPVVQSRSPCQTPQPCGFTRARCAQCVSPETPVPEPRGPVPYLVPGGCISLCCSRCPVSRARHPAAVWRKQAATSQHHIRRLRSLCPSCPTTQRFPRGKCRSATARALSIHRFPTKDVQIKQEKRAIFFKLQADAFIQASSLLCLIISKRRKLKWMLAVLQQNKSLHIALTSQEQ